MLGSQFEHKTTRKIVALFGTIFNNIHITSQGATRLVPVKYGPQDRWLAILEQKKDQGELRNQITMPLMSYELVDIAYDASRQMSPFPRIKGTNADGDSTISRMNRVPYTASFELNVLAGSINEALSIVEQILPYFHPSFVLAADEADKLGIHTDVAFSIEGVTINDDWEADYSTLRTITWTIGFNAKFWLDGPIDLSGVNPGTHLIKHIDINYYTRLENAIAQEYPMESIEWDIMPDSAGPDDPHVKILSCGGSEVGSDQARMTADNMAWDEDSLGNAGEIIFDGSHTITGVTGASLGVVRTLGSVANAGTNEWGYIVQAFGAGSLDDIRVGVSNDTYDTQDVLGATVDSLAINMNGDVIINNVVSLTLPYAIAVGDTIFIKYRAVDDDYYVTVNDEVYIYIPSHPAGTLKPTASLTTENDSVSIILKE